MKLRRHITDYTLAVAALMIIALGTGIKLHTPAFDTALLNFLFEYRRPWLDISFRILTWAGSLYVLIPLSGVLSYILFRPHWQAPARQLIIALLVTAGIVYLLKFAFDRSRPQTALIDTNLDYAFPSNHAAQITVFMLMLVILIRERQPGLSNLMIAIAVITILLVSSSRLYLQVHYPTDAIAGILSGGVAVLALRAWAQRTRH